MIIIIAQIIFALSILGILIIIFRKIPIILKYPRSAEEKEMVDLREQWEKIKDETKITTFFHDSFIPGTEKFLRRIKIILLKFDNFLAKRVDKLRAKMKKRNGEDNDFSDEV
jgi:hypothetical protein